MDTDDTFSNARLALQGETLTTDTVRLVPTNELHILNNQLSKYHNKKSIVCNIKSRPVNLHGDVAKDNGRSTMLVEILASDVSIFINVKMIFSTIILF